MRLALLALCPLALLASSCATTSDVHLDSYRGVYSTHFDGIPDQMAICARVTNQSSETLRWIRLELRAFSELGEVPGRWTSGWLYPRPLRPGESVALRFENPPTADQIELKVSGSGKGSAPHKGRPLRRSHSCSEALLQGRLKSASGERSAASVKYFSVLRRNDPAPTFSVAQER